MENHRNLQDQNEAEQFNEAQNEYDQNYPVIHHHRQDAPDQKDFLIVTLQEQIRILSMENMALHNLNQWQDHTIQIQANQVYQMKENVEELENNFGNMEAEKEYWRISYFEEKDRLNELKEKKNSGPSSSSSFPLLTPVRSSLNSSVMATTDHNGKDSQMPGTSKARKFEDAVGKWLNWEHKDDEMDGIDLGQFLFRPDGEQVVPQTVRKAPSLFFLFTAHTKMEKGGERLAVVWEKMKDDEKKDWEQKGDILARWQRYQVAEGWIETATSAEMKKMKAAKKRKAE